MVKSRTVELKESKLKAEERKRSIKNEDLPPGNAQKDARKEKPTLLIKIYLIAKQPANN